MYNIFAANDKTPVTKTNYFYKTTSPVVHYARHRTAICAYCLLPDM